METLEAIVSVISPHSIVFQCAQIGEVRVPSNSKLLVGLGELHLGARVKMTIGEYGEVWRVRLP
jgi:hypothetical protein